MCEQNGGFTVVREPNGIEVERIGKLEDIVRQVIENLPFDLPPCKVITSETATWRGMAVCVRQANSSMNYRGVAVRYQIPYIVIKRSLLLAAEPNVALGTYLHELAHIFGGDSSANFSRGLSEFLDAALAHAGKIQTWKRKWTGKEVN